MVRTRVKPSRYAAGTLFVASRTTAGGVHEDGVFLPFAVASVISFALIAAATASHSVEVCEAVMSDAMSTHSTSASVPHHDAMSALSAAEPPGIVQAITVVIGSAALMRVTASL